MPAIVLVAGGDGLGHLELPSEDGVEAGPRLQRRVGTTFDRCPIDCGAAAEHDETEERIDQLGAGFVVVTRPFDEKPQRISQSDLDGFRCPIPVAADESVQGLADIEGLVGRFDIVNIKLDKCGGLTEGLEMAAEARRHGLGVMVGNMVGSSLAMAPAWILVQACDLNDLDGTLFIARDRIPAMVFEHGKVSYPQGGWGSPG